MKMFLNVLCIVNLLNLLNFKKLNFKMVPYKRIQIELSFLTDFSRKYPKKPTVTFVCPELIMLNFRMGKVR